MDRAFTPPPASAAPPADASTATRLDAFLGAASAGPLLWARWVEGRLQVCGGSTPGQPISSEIGRLFVQTLREHFGAAASAIAEREWQLNQQPRRLLPARTVHHAVACAESAYSLLMAQSHLMQIEFSAAMLGWRFRRVAEALGLDAESLGPERRQALDAQLDAEFKTHFPADADAVTRRLRELLSQGLH